MSRLRAVTLFLVALLVIGLAPVLCAQAAAAVTGAPIVPTDANEWGSSFTLGIVTSIVMEWWKRSPLGGLSDRTSYVVQRAIALALAFAGALGLSVTFDGSHGTLTIAGLMLPSVGQAAWHTLRQFFFNEYIYRSGVKPRAATS